MFFHVQRSDSGRKRKLHEKRTRAFEHNPIVARVLTNKLHTHLGQVGGQKEVRLTCKNVLSVEAKNINMDKQDEKDKERYESLVFVCSAL